MKLPFLNHLSKKSIATVGFLGLNRSSAIIKDGELSDSHNMSQRLAPALSTRLPRERISVASSLYDGGQKCPVIFASDKLVRVTPASLRNPPYTMFDVYYGDSVVGSLAKLPTSVIEFQDRICFFPDKKAYNKATGTFASIGAGVYPESGAVPDIDYACVHDNRVFGVSTKLEVSGVRRSIVYVSSLGNLYDWTTFSVEGDYSESGAYAVEIASPGDFTGICSYRNHVVIFKQTEMYELYGQYPSTYSIVKVADVGCVDASSIVTVDYTLYFASGGGIMAYSGGVPVNISRALGEVYYYYAADGEFLFHAPMGSDGKSLYLSLKAGGGSSLYVYDLFAKRWIKEDSLPVSSFCYYKNQIYAGVAVKSETIPNGTDISIWRFCSGEEDVDWSFTTQPFYEFIGGKKIISRVYVRVEPKTSADIYIDVSVDGGEFKTITSAQTFEPKTLKLSVNLPPCDSFSIRVGGRGNVTIPFLERIYYMGGEN